LEQLPHVGDVVAMREDPVDQVEVDCPDLLGQRLPSGVVKFVPECQQVFLSTGRKLFQ